MEYIPSLKRLHSKGNHFLLEFSFFIPNSIPKLHQSSPPTIFSGIICIPTTQSVSRNCSTCYFKGKEK